MILDGLCVCLKMGDAHQMAIGESLKNSDDPSELGVLYVQTKPYEQCSKPLLVDE